MTFPPLSFLFIFVRVFNDQFQRFPSATLSIYCIQKPRSSFKLRSNERLRFPSKKIFHIFFTLLIADRDETWTWWIIDQRSSFLYRQNKKKTDGEEISGTSWFTINSSRARVIERSSEQQRISSVWVQSRSVGAQLHSSFGLCAHISSLKNSNIWTEEAALLLFVRSPRRSINASHASN